MVIKNLKILLKVLVRKLSVVILNIKLDIRCYVFGNKFKFFIKNLRVFYWEVLCKFNI